MTEDGVVIGECVIMDTRYGSDLKKIFASGGNVGVSSRAFGTVKVVDGVEVVNEDFELITYDFVANPACQTAYPTPVSEGVTSSVSESRKTVNTQPVMVQYLPDYNNIKTVKDLKAKFPDLVEEVKRSVLEESKDKIKEAVKDSLADDGDSIAILKKIKQLVSPIVVEDSTKAQINDLKSELSESKKIIESQQEVIDSLVKAARTTAYTLYLERVCRKENMQVVLEALGDLSSYESLDVFKSKYKKVLDDITLAKKIVNEKVEAIKEKSTKIVNDVSLKYRTKLQESLKKQEKLEAGLSEALDIIDDLKQRYKEAVAAARIQRNVPSLDERKKLLKASKGKSIKELDEMIDESSGISSTLYSRVNDTVKKGSFRKINEVRDRMLRTDSNTDDDIDNILGISMQEIASLSKVK